MSQREWAEKDYYRVLGVPKDATPDAIKRAYRKLAQKHHPDANKGDAAAETRFKEISEAYAILSNPEKRAQYDQLRSFVEAGGERIYGFGPNGGGGVRVNIGDIGDLFGDAGGRGGSVFDDLLGGFGFGTRGARRGRDVETQIQLSFEDAIEGVTVSLPDAGKVRIPPGVGNGARIKVPGRGEPSSAGGPSGDLFVRVSVAPHPLFGRGKRGDLEITAPVTFTEAALGTELEVPTLSGSVKVKVPPGTSSGRTLRVKGRGAPRPNGGTGDLLVRVEVEVPKKLSRRERELLEQFRAEHHGNPRAHFAEHLGRERAGRASQGGR